MRKKNLPATPHTPLTDRLGTTEHKIRKEIAIMKKCRHGHVVRLLEVIDDKLKEKIYMGKLLPISFVHVAQDIPSQRMSPTPHSFVDHPWPLRERANIIPLYLATI